MHPLIEKHRTELEATCREFSVRRLELFGSAARDDFDVESSDLDFLVEFDDPGPLGAFHQFFGFEIALSRVFNKSVDLSEFHLIDNPYLRRAIERDRTPVYESQSQVAAQ